MINAFSNGVYTASNLVAHDSRNAWKVWVNTHASKNVCEINAACLYTYEHLT